MTKEIKLENVIISYPFLFTLNNKKYDKSKYSATFILDKSKHADKIKEIKEEIARLARERNIELSSLSKVCLQDGDATDKDEYQNSYIIKTSNLIKPIVVNQDGVTAVTESDNLLNVGGANVLTYITLRLYDNEYGKGVSAYLHGVQYLKSSNKFGGIAFNSEGKFKPVTQEEVIDIFG